MARRIGFLIACLLFSIGNSYASDEGREENLERIVTFKEKYTVNRVAFDKFAVAFYCTLTTEDQQAPGKSTVRNLWFIQAVDINQNRRRYDTMQWGISATNLAPIEVIGTIVLENNKMKLYKYGNTQSIVDLKQFPRENGSDQVLSVPVIRFDPWDLPIGGQSMLEPVHSVLRHITLNSHKGFESRWPRNYTVFRTILNKSLFEFVTNEKEKIFQQIVFDTGTNLPVESDMIVRQDSYNGVMSSVATEWLRLEEDPARFVPGTMIVNSVFGNPRSPATKVENKLEGYWIFGEDVLPEFFLTETLLSTVDLREYILQKSRNVHLRKAIAADHLTR